MPIQKSLNRFRKDAKAISPLIATLLLIAIAVAASVITYSWVMSMISSQSAQAQTQVRVDSATIATGGGSITSVVIRNTGSVDATIESINVRKNTSGSAWSINSITSGNSIATGKTATFASLTSIPSLATGDSVVIRATTTTGFYYEFVATVP